jgi:hypothetical protein
MPKLRLGEPCTDSPGLGQRVYPESVEGLTNILNSFIVSSRGFILPQIKLHISRIN